MKIELLAYAFVTPGEEKMPECAIGEVKPEVLDYFSRHLTKIRDKAKTNVVDPALFQAVKGAKPGEESFAALRSGSNDEFIAGANALVGQLHSVTDSRMNRGFFVALRAVDEEKTLASVLKLDVYDFPAARLKQLDANSALFEPVLDLLDLPGDLHKGALFPDPRSASDVAVVDVVGTHYFLRSLNARLFLSGQVAVDHYAYLLHKEAPDVAKRVLEEAEERAEPATATELIQTSGVLSQAAKDKILKELGKPRSIGKVDARSYPRTTTIYADGIEISGTEQEIADKVRERQVGAKWLIEITANSQPQWTTR